jgi:hypothetical protein
MILAPGTPFRPRLHAPLNQRALHIHIYGPRKSVTASSGGSSVACTSAVLFIDRACVLSAGRLLSLASLASALHPLHPRSTRSTSKPVLPDRSLQIPDAPISLASPLTLDTLSVNTFPSHSFLSFIYVAFPFQLCLTEMCLASLRAYEHFSFSFHRDLIGVNRRKDFFLRVAISGCSSAALRRYWTYSTLMMKRVLVR